MEQTQNNIVIKHKNERIKIMALKQLFQKKHTLLEKFIAKLGDYYGQVEDCAILFIWGKSGGGKSEYTMQLVKDMCDEGKLLYISLEEKTRATIKMRAKRYLSEELHSGKIIFWDDQPEITRIMMYLKKKKSPKIVIIDSLQYLRINYEQYIKLKECFPKKLFIILSHANTSGKEPKGKTADDVRYDADIKVFIEGKVAFIDSRYEGGGMKNYIIWPEGAQKYWAGQYAAIQRHELPVNRHSFKADAKKSKPKPKKTKTNDDNTPLPANINTKHDSGILDCKTDCSPNQ